MARNDSKSNSGKRVEVHYFTRQSREAGADSLSRADTVTMPEVSLPGKGSSHARRKGEDHKTLVEGPRERPERRVRPKKAMTPEQTAQMSLFGHQLYEKGLVEESRVVFEGLVSLEVEEAFPYTMLGTIYLALDDSERALALFDAALRIDRDDLAALVYKGEIQLSRNQLKPAKENLSRAVTLGLKSDPFVQRAVRLLKMVQDKTRSIFR